MLLAPDSKEAKINNRPVKMVNLSEGYYQSIKCYDYHN